MIRALAIDTASQMCSVALQVGGEIIERQTEAANQHSNLVLGMVDELLAEAGVTLAQLDLIINDVGPGSFTGIRIGLGVTQGLAYGADVPVLGVDSLSTLAFGVKDKTDDAILAAIDARMGQVYWGLFNKSAHSVLLQGELGLCAPENIESIPTPIYAVGNAWDVCRESLSRQVTVVEQAQCGFPLAKHALMLGLEAPSMDWQPAANLLPIYLRNDVAKVSNKS